MLERLPCGGAPMSCALHPASRVVGLLAWALAFTVASGASTPRLRAAGRERVARAGIARASSLRPDDPRAWMAPGSEHDPDHTVAVAVVGITTAPASTDHTHTDGPFWSLAPTHWTAVAPSSFLFVNQAAFAQRLTFGLVGPAVGRAPPLT